MFRDSSEEKTLKEILAALQRTEVTASDNNALLRVVVAEQIASKQLLQRIVDNTNPPPNTTGFTAIKEITMVPLAAGQTATFSTTPIPSTSAPIAASLIWSSSDSVNAPVSPNTADATGLSTLVVFPSTVAAGVTFSLTLSYTNSDGTLASQTNSFTTVAPPSPDVTGFAPITQTA